MSTRPVRKSITANDLHQAKSWFTGGKKMARNFQVANAIRRSCGANSLSIIDDRDLVPWSQSGDDIFDLILIPGHLHPNAIFTGRTRERGRIRLPFE